MTANQRYYSIRGKIRGVHPALKKIGVTEIKIDCENEEIGFIFNEGKILFILLYPTKHLDHIMDGLNERVPEGEGSAKMTPTRVGMGIG